MERARPFAGLGSEWAAMLVRVVGETSAHIERDTGTQLDRLLVLRRVLLHLLQFADAQLADEGLLAEVTSRSARLAAEQLHQCEEIHAAPVVALDLHETAVVQVPTERAMQMQRAFHYLGSARAAHLHLALIEKCRGATVAACSFSGLDVPQLRLALPEGVAVERCLVMSRFFTFGGAPRNTSSYATARFFEVVSSLRPNTALAFSYCDPNVGFLGTSYRAAGWRLFAVERKRRYAYLDASYVTDRELIARFGTAETEKLAVKLGDRITLSIREIAPLEVYAFAVDDEFASWLESRSVEDLEPLPSLGRRS